jgi:hypothetical protein
VGVNVGQEKISTPSRKNKHSFLRRMFDVYYKLIFVESYKITMLLFESKFEHHHGIAVNETKNIDSNQVSVFYLLSFIKNANQLSPSPIIFVFFYFRPFIELTINKISKNGEIVL